MDNLTQVMENFATVFEQCLLTDDPMSHLDTLPDSKAKSFMKEILKPYSKQWLKELKKKFKISDYFLENIKQWKTQESFSAAKTVDDIKELIEDFVKNNPHQFKYSQPAEFKISAHQNEQQKTVLPSTLPEELPLRECALLKLQENEDEAVRVLNNKAFSLLSFSELSCLKLSSRERIASRQFLASFCDEEAVSFIKNIYEDKRKENQNYELNNTYFDMLTMGQFYSLLEHIPTLTNNSAFLKKWFDYKFLERLDEFDLPLNITQKDEKKALYLQMIDEIEKLNAPKMRGILERIMRELLILDLSREDPSQDLFLNYIRNYSDTSESSYEAANYRLEKREKMMKKRAANEQKMIFIQIPLSSMSENSLIQEYLTALFASGNSEALINDLEKYFERSKLVEISTRVRIRKGEDVKDADNILSTHQLKELKEAREITILDKTKRQFKLNDEVELKLRIKNISSITVKIYQLNSEKYYLENTRQIDQTENLSFLHPNHTYVYEVPNQNPHLVTYHDVKIEGIGSSRGIWIIQLEGEGITSRVFLRKGAIAYHETKTSVGNELTFHDEEGKRVSDLGIWMAGTKHPVSEKFIIPYAEKPGYVELIVVKDNYAQKIRVYNSAEEYNLSVGFIYSSESFLVGNKAKMMLHPRLSLASDNHTTVSVKLMEKVNVTVTLTNVQDITSTIHFENVRFNDKEDYCLQFPVQAYMKEIQILVKGQITKYNKKEMEVFSSHNICIDAKMDNDNFLDFYLRKNQEGQYCLSVLGADGEIMPGLQCKIDYLPYGWKQRKGVRLMTDEKGQVYLGKLQNIPSFEVVVDLKLGPIIRSWDLLNHNSDVLYLNEAVYQEGEEINIPLWKESPFRLIRKMKNGAIIQKLNHLCRVKNDRLIIRDLAKGYYELQIIALNHKIRIRVLRGDRLEGTNMIIEQNKALMHQIPNNSSTSIMLGEPSIQREQDTLSITVPVSQPSTFQQSFKAHLVATNYICPNISKSFDPAKFRFIGNGYSKPIQIKESHFYNNKKMSEEASYVVNRGKEKTFIGNNLEKPRIFLKRIEVRQTFEEEERLDEEGEYLQEYAEGRGGGGGQISENRLRGAGGKKHGSLVRLSQNLPENISSLNNFLEVPGTIIDNANGRNLKFSVPKSFTHFKVILFTETNSLQKSFDCPSDQILKKNLTHGGTVEKDEKSAWSMSREMYPVHNGESINVGRDSVWVAVGLTEIINFAKIKKILVKHWILNWSSYSEQKKLKVYDQKVSHELNCYIKFHDPEFFKKTVRPFIANKLVKTFVDLCLLEDDQACKWAQISELKKLNQFEKVLLVRELVRVGRKDEALAIAVSMEDTCKSRRKSFEEFKAAFDTVITAKLIQQAIRPPQAPMLRMAMQEKSKMKFNKKAKKKMIEKKCEDEEEEMSMMSQQSGEEIFKKRGKFKQDFQEMEKTKEYTETTYEGMKDPSLSTSLIRSSPFWAEAALHFAKSSTTDFLSDKFMYLRTKEEFTLASCFIPSSLVKYEMKPHSDSILIKGQSSFFIFVREVKSLPFEKKFGIMINQRFYNPDDRYYYEEDGTSVEKEISEFVHKRPYCLQTLITNTSGTPLELQIFIDLPQGSLPLRSHEYTQIVNQKIDPYTTKSLERFFYFPKAGQYELYPANACRKDTVIAKADVIKCLKVVEVQRKEKVESLEDAMKTGNKGDVLNFIGTKNIFDSRFFSCQQILWMLDDKEFFSQAIKIFRSRKYCLPEIWKFGYLHKDLETILQFEQMKSENNKRNSEIGRIPIFEYFPYYSKRAHRFLDENKSTIRNKQFRETYYGFIFNSFLSKPTDSTNRVTFAYYLILQDRIDDAARVCQLFSQQDRSHHQIQIDYLDCFIDMCQGSPSFNKARAISGKYANYPIATWNYIFKDVINTLQEYDSEPVLAQEIKDVEYSTRVINEGSQLRISIPEKTTVQIHIYNLNLELYYSAFPFQDFKNFSSDMRPNKSINIAAGESREEKYVRQKELKDCFVEIYEQKENSRDKKVESFLWTNPAIKVQMKEKTGMAQVFVKGRKQAGCYCKVFQMKNGSSKFYRDGYTDIAGIFKYALADLQGITMFSILFVTEQGAVIQQVKPPSQQGYIE